jgi:hypothetical protein
VNAKEPYGPGNDGDAGGWSPNLLTRIATTIGSRQRENVATAVLLYVMQADLAAGRAFVAAPAQRGGSPRPEGWAPVARLATQALGRHPGRADRLICVRQDMRLADHQPARSATMTRL